MTGKKQAAILMSELLGFAEKMLSEYGEFHPFGGYLKPSGAVVHVGVQSSQIDKNAQQEIDTLVQSFKQLALQRKAIAFGIAVDVRLPKLDGTKGDAVEFLLEHQEGYCAEVFFRYEIKDGKVEFTGTTAQQGEPRFFATAH